MGEESSISIYKDIKRIFRTSADQSKFFHKAMNQSTQINRFLYIIQIRNTAPSQIETI